MDSNYYFYILRCKNNSRYYGYTNDLYRRLREHSCGRIQSTNKKRPVVLVYYEECHSRSEAFRREMQFKNGKTRAETIEKLINSFPDTKCQGFNSHSDLCSLSLHKSRAL